MVIAFRQCFNAVKFSLCIQSRMSSVSLVPSVILQLNIESLRIYDIHTAISLPSTGYRFIQTYGSSMYRVLDFILCLVLCIPLSILLPPLSVRVCGRGKVQMSPGDWLQYIT